MVDATRRTKKQDWLVAADDVFNESQTRFVAMQLFISDFKDLIYKMSSLAARRCQLSVERAVYK